MRELKPVYTIQTCMSRVDSGLLESIKLTEKMDSVISEIKSGYVVCWLHHAILIGRIKNQELLFYDNQQPDYSRHLIRIRIFDRDMELHAWRTGSGFRYRLRHDGTGENSSEYAEAIQPLWGTRSTTCDPFPEWSHITENRGTDMVVPFGDLKLNDNRRLSIVTRNYLAPLAQAGYVDCRFVKFDHEGGNG